MRRVARGIEWIQFGASMRMWLQMMYFSAFLGGVVVGVASGCAKGASHSTPACRDGKDNDGDGLIDYPQDPDCTSKDDTSEGKAVSKGCGNGVLDEGEVCDDGNREDGDACRGDCGQDLTLCGNGTLDQGEICDDGNRQDGDSCSSDCSRDLTKCGNGVLDEGEVCDDGNRVDGDACRGDCGQDLTLCGNGQLDRGEFCDDGKPPGQSACSDDCRANTGVCDKNGDCMLCHVCDQTGHCAPAEVGTDPRADCDQDPEQTCGYDGTCDGHGSCRRYGSEVQCGEASCEGTVLHMSRYCNGLGSCQAAGDVDCAPDVCTLPSAPQSGLACGGGDPVVLTNDATEPQEFTFEGNLLHSGGENWYRVGAVAADGQLSIYVWFDENPGNEFAFEVELGSGNVDDCSDGARECNTMTAYTQYSFVFDQCDTECDELGRNVYLGVKRASGVTPTCSQYRLTVRLGGSKPWP